ncbi:MAG: ribosome assembly cofactor RimP [Bacteroidota bacterium]|nr:ribosome assembly cofactor RimP [Bacteroidota bacterium]
MVTKERIEKIVNEWIKSTECFLVDVKTAPGRIAISIDKPAGVTIEECSSLNRFITDTLDPEMVWETNELEVGSPGMDQPFKVYQQYLRRIGREIRVITLDGHVYKGRLEAADENGFELLETISRKVDKKKVVSEIKHQLLYSKIKETKLLLSFKN